MGAVVFLHHISNSIVDPLCSPPSLLQQQLMRMHRGSPMLCALFLLAFLPPPFSSALDHLLPTGSSLSVEDHNTSFLVSADASFAAGFYEVGINAFAFAVWFRNSANKTIAWAANRDRPVNGRRSGITLRLDGSFTLTDFDGTVVWSSNTTGPADKVELLNSGNLVVVAAKNRLWQSFDSPTDTLLPTQHITKSTPLVSNSYNGSSFSGFYRFYFDSDNVLRLIYDDPELSSIYWPESYNNLWEYGLTSYKSTRFGMLDELGNFSASDQLAVSASDYGRGITRRLTLDYDGNLRIYSLSNESGAWYVTWQALQQPCNIHGTCGRNGICVYENEKKAEGACPPGFQVADPRDWRQGCRRKYNFSSHAMENYFLRLPYTDFWGFDLSYTTGLSLRECRNKCENDYLCEAFAYTTLSYMTSGICYPKATLFNGRTSPSITRTIYLKLPKNKKQKKFSSVPLTQKLICSGLKVKSWGPLGSYQPSTKEKSLWEYLYSFVATFFLIEAFFITVGWWFMFRRDHNPTVAEYEAISSQFKRFSYSDLKKATRNFQNVLGKGGSGIVYKGIFADGQVMAVKNLEDIVQGEEEFQTELSLIGKVNHRNLVRTFGFCYDCWHRLLITEYIERGSLDKYLSQSGTSSHFLKWNQRFKIALGVAKGLAYLHHECLEWVIHCDVKPENILLDQDFEPKIADFGLVKFLNKGGASSNLSRIRGTRGYIALEWASSLPINGKVDVYSYGMVLLELVKGERVSNWVVDRVDEMELEVRRLVAATKEMMESGDQGWVEEFVDGKLGDEIDWRQALVILQIAVSCLLEERSKRPSMDFIVKILLHAMIRIKL